MFDIEFTDELTRELKVLSSKNRILLMIFRKKMREIINNDVRSIDRYKHLRAPLNNLQRVHLTSNKILLFRTDKKNNSILFVSIRHWDDAY